MSSEDQKGTTRSNKSTWVTVRTTTPHLPSSASRAHITTPRLLIRPLQASDLDGLHSLRSQPEVMRWSSAGRVDINRQETEHKVLLTFLPPADVQSFNCAMCWRETGEFIGVGGVHKIDGHFGWPEIGYMLIKEYWGVGLGTEFLQEFMQMWEALDRRPLEMRVDGRSLVDQDTGASSLDPGRVLTAKEQVDAVIDATNAPSQRVLEKCGFKKFVELGEGHHNDCGESLTLHGFRWCPSV